MIKKILNKFGYILKSESDEKLRGVHEMYESQISTLDREKNILELELIALRKKEEESKPIFDFNIGDPIPGGDARKGYVASATSAARFRAALITTGFGALIVGIGLLVANFFNLIL